MTLKFQLVFIAIQLSILACFGQKVDTIRLYNFESIGDKWRIKLFSNNTFNLTSDFPYASNNKEIVLKGVYQKNDTTIKFICDTTKVKNKKLLNNKLKSFSNIPYIGQGEIFRCQLNYFIPYHIIFSLDDSSKVPDGLFASYYRGDGFGSYFLEIKKDNTYKFREQSCSGSSNEEGTWIESKNVITLIPSNKSNTMLDWVTSNQQFYVDQHFLIGKKSTRTNGKTITEVYYYLSKQPL